MAWAHRFRSRAHVLFHPTRPKITRYRSEPRQDLKRKRIWPYCKVCPTKPVLVTNRASTFSGASPSFTGCERGNRKKPRRSVGVEHSRLLPVSLKERLAFSRRKPRATLKKGPSKVQKTSTPGEGILTKPPALARPFLSENPRSSVLVRWSALLCLPSIL